MDLEEKSSENRGSTWPLSRQDQIGYHTHTHTHMFLSGNVSMGFLPLLSLLKLIFTICDQQMKWSSMSYFSLSVTSSCWGADCWTPRGETL